jgi:hypothetical protein
MLFIAWFVWIVIWGVIGYTSVRTIKTRIEEKRAMKSMMGHWAKQAELQRNYNSAMYNAIKSAEKGD